MSRNIKTVECLSKHVGKTVKVVDDKGHTFLATVEEGPVLYTTDKKAADSTYWWMSDEDRYGHLCRRYYQITDELKSLTLVSEKKPAKKTKKVKAETKKIVLADELKKNVGHFCEMADGSTGFIAGSKYPGNVCVLHNSDGSSEGWIISKSDNISEIKGVSKSFIKKFSKGWHVGSDFEAKQVKVMKILESSEAYESEETKSKKTILDLTVREVLEKLNEIIISR